MDKPVRKAVLPVAGLGTRFLPATKVLAKEMLPVVDKPLIQYAIEESLEAGIEEFILVTSRGKSVVEDHFDRASELEGALKARGKEAELRAIRDCTLRPGTMSFVRQQEPLGLGHAIWCARRLVGDEPFAVILVDDFILAAPGCLKQMVDVHGEVGGTVIAVEDVPREFTNRYGILDVIEDDGRLARAKGLVEKPDPAAAPSTLSIIGRYILPPEVFLHLGRHERGAGGEIQLTDAMARTLDTIPCHGLRFQGRRYDCGNKLGFIEANVAAALARADMAPAVRNMLRTHL